MGTTTTSAKGRGERAVREAAGRELAAWLARGRVREGAPGTASAGGVIVAQVADAWLTLADAHYAGSREPTPRPLRPLRLRFQLLNC